MGQGWEIESFRCYLDHCQSGLPVGAMDTRCQRLDAAAGIQFNPETAHNETVSCWGMLPSQKAVDK